MKYRALLLAAAMLALAACSSKDKKVDEPAKLTDIKNPAVRIQKLWSTSVGGGGKKQRLGLGLGVGGDHLYAAGRDGEVAAFDLKTGKQAWRTKTELALAGGTGVGAGLVVVGSLDGQVVALSADNGAELWSAEQQIPKLTLRGVSAPVVAHDMAISGFDNGRVLAVSIADGATVWDSPVSPPHGRTELERLNDIDAPVRVVGDDVFVAGYQGRAAMLALDSGQVWWTHDVSSYRGVDVDDEQMYVATSLGEVVALKKRSGAEVWRNDSLKNRGLSAPAVVGDYVAVADLDGYVHFFDRATGTAAGRTKTSGDRVTNAPLAVNGVLYVISDKGDVTALHGLPTGARAAKVEPTAHETTEPPPPPSDGAVAPSPGG